MRPIFALENTGPLPNPGAQAMPVMAERSSRRLVRFAPDIVRELPDERQIRIDVNGCFAGTALAIPDAPRELAVGWAFLHGFFDDCGELGRVTVDGDRVSVMVESGEDIDRRRLEAVGWAEHQPLSEPDPPEGEPFRIGEMELVGLIDAAWRAFRQDGGSDGYLHVAVASGDGIHCIARDRTIDMAAAKILGWMLLDGRDEESSILLVRGILGRHLVEAAARVGISLIATSAVPTTEGFRAATGLSMTLVGMALSRSMGLLIDGGHIVEGKPDAVTNTEPDLD